MKRAEVVTANGQDASATQSSARKLTPVVTERDQKRMMIDMVSSTIIATHTLKKLRAPCATSIIAALAAGNRPKRSTRTVQREV